MRSRWLSLSRMATGMAFVAVVVFAGLPAWPAAALQDFPQENAWARVTPSVVWCDDPESLVTVEVHIVGRSDVEEVRVENGPIREVTLYDDGTHGDELWAWRLLLVEDTIYLPIILKNF